jgi:S-adenosylmethionine:tRNA ribosyltransferase-isomerase
MNYSLSDFDFTLPPELIAQHPAAERSASRLLVPTNSGFNDAHFKNLLNLVHPGDVLVFNTSKVIPARLYAIKETGGQVEILVERILSSHEASVLLRVSKKPAPGSFIHAEGCVIEVLGRDPLHDDRFRLRFDQPVLDVLNRQGEIPLPPYITHKPDEEDSRRYQTVYAQEPGSVAAPTAGLHFDEAMLQALDAAGVHRAAVTLHVGTGTFAPVRTENLDEHRMHSEWCEVPEATAELIAQARKDHCRVIAVGTTSLRTLESAALDGKPGLIRAGSWETDIFIKPGYSFRVVDALLTNFHLPRSTLLMLVAAFVGYDRMHEIYAHAIAQRYRFFSYGDAMFLQRSQA